MGRKSTRLIPPAVPAGLIDTALDEDGARADITTGGTVPHGKRGSAKIIAKQQTVIAGISIITAVYARLDKNVRVKILVPDGTVVKKGTVLARIAGPIGPILAGERTALNFLQRFCGIASLTRDFNHQLRGTRTILLDTRKTTPGYRAWEKYSVACGGGKNHRLGLHDGILVKENHIASAGGVKRAIELLKPAARKKNLPLEVEVRTFAELKTAIECRADIVLLDNMTPRKIRRAVAFTDSMARRGVGNGTKGNRVRKPALEVSGGVSLKNIRSYALTGVDRISVGRLTHSAPAADLSMLVEME